MSTVNHSAASGIHPGAYVQSGDPGAVGAGILWIDTTGSAPFQLKKRNSGNTGWDLVGITGSVATEFAAADFKATGITGAATAARLVGANASGAPASGTFVAGDVAVDLTGKVWICTTGGSPGTWVAAGAGGALSELADVVVAGSVTTNITFSSISGSYTTLLVNLTCRGDEATTGDVLLVRLNNDSGSNYDGQCVEVITGQTVLRAMNTTSLKIAEVACASAPAGAAWSGQIWIPHYTDTTFWKAVTAFGGGDFNTNSLDQTQGAGQWKSTAAVTQIDIIAPGGGHWVAGTHARLFGLN